MEAAGSSSLLVAGFMVIVPPFLVSTAAAIWPGHVEYSLNILDGTDGFVVTAEYSTGRLGYSVAGAGDVNNDGFNDVILGESPEFSSTAGAAYVVFGSESFSFVDIDVSTLDGTNGFKIDGTDVGDYAGTSVASAGDVNGDGFDDVIMGAWGASSGAGEVLVIFGADSHPAVVGASDLDGITGFLIWGATTSDASGFSVSSGGDVNNDGADDILIGAYRADPEGSMSGAAYIVFGSTTWSKDTVDLAELGGSGITLEGGGRREYAGYSVAGAGDVNDDGYSDVIIAAYGASEAYVFYGAPTFASTIYALNTLSGTDGFAMVVGNDGDEIIVAGVGDLNSDGYADVAVGHALADPTSNSAGSTFIVLGGPAISSPLNLATGLDGTTGFVIQGSASGDKSGTSIANAGDLNQDGYGDVVVGAPGVGDDVGAAYILFGAERFADSYGLGSLDGDNGFVLMASASGGYAGCSVAGIGDVNQDGYPDLAVGAYGSGTAGEAYVVFPHLTGTPPPTPSPTPAPTAPTLAPFRVREGPTPAPTTNFLVDGVVGGGTIYEAPEVFVKAQELGGEVSLAASRWFDDDTSISVSLSNLKEKDSGGDVVGLAATVPHVIYGDAVVYTASPTTHVTIGGVAACTSNMTSSVLDGETVITITMIVYKESGVITNGDEQTQVAKGDLKISLSVSDWPFCDPTSLPTADATTTSAVTPLTVCYGASSALEAGTYLDATLVVRGPSSAAPAERDGEQDSVSSDTIGSGKQYEMIAGSAEATLIMSEWVHTDDYGWTKAEMSLSESSSFIIRFPASSGSLYYDPIVDLVLASNEHDDKFWETEWFTWSARVFAVLVVLCAFAGITRSCRRKRATKDKVSPSFEGVAPAADSIANGGKGRGTVKKIMGCVKTVFCCCYRRSAWYKNAKATPAPISNHDKKITMATRIKFPSLRHQSPSRKKANKSIGGTGAADGNTKGASELHAATPDWIKDVGGADGGTGGTATGTDKTSAAVPDWLAEAAGPALAATAAAEGVTDQQGEGGYYEGYEGYEGYEYGGYEGYDGYGYDGYYDGGYYNNGDANYYGGDVDGNGGGGAQAAGGNGGQNAQSTPAVAPNTPAAGGGDGMSWLTNAAGTVNAMNKREEDEEGAPVANVGNANAHCRLPPIAGGDGVGGGMDVAPAPMPWMSAR